MKKKKQPTLASVTAEYKKRGFKRPKSLAKHYMAGFKAAQKYKVKWYLFSFIYWNNRFSSYVIDNG